MSVTPTELATHYPRLYHMAEGSSWESIQRHGLLSTEALLNLFLVPVADRPAILSTQRNKSVPIKHPDHGVATIRDQKPLNRSKLEKKALEGCSFEQWLNMLNSRVFFWLCKERLQTLMCAREYCSQTHVVLILDTLRLATDFQQSITLAPMNTGNTRPFAHKRSLQTFCRMVDYPFEERLHRGLYYTVVELAVEGGVTKIMDYLIEAAEMKCSTCDKDNQTIRTVRKLYP
ncbi:MAG TPA: hypothetical protein VGM18_01160 [Candidatus Sulfotelmatobacter sp.]|jgi:hypothetical protein